jgi:UDP-galactopyranose mutase
MMLDKYDYLIVGCGLYGITFAREATNAGKSCLIIDKRPHIGGNCYTEKIEGIDVHTYGPHIFHTANQDVWDYVNQFATFNHYVNRPKVSYNDKIYSFPINLMTMQQVYGVRTPEEAKAKLEEVKIKNDNPKNLEEWILSQVGPELYNIFIKGYTTKQWNTEPKNLPASIIKRLPIRFNYDDNYFNDPYQGIPVDGYTKMMQRMLNGIEVILKADFFKDRARFEEMGHKIVYTGPIDQFYDYQFGMLDYRSLRFEHKLYEIEDFQGNAVVNYTDVNVPFTRITEHKHFSFGKQPVTYVTTEYPDNYTPEKIPYYPVRDAENSAKYEKYHELAKMEEKYIFGGRLGRYVYWDMHQVIAAALHDVKKEIQSEVFIEK